MFKEKIKEDNIIEVQSLPIEIENGRTYAIQQPNPNSFTHGYFKYPCKFIPELPRWAIKKYLGDNSIYNVFDPFSGSGTTLLEAIVNGNNSFGTEIDSFAKMLVEVKTSPFNHQEIQFVGNWLDNQLIKYQNTFSNYENPFVPDINNLFHWFTQENAQKLGVIKSEINKISNTKISNFFNVCFASSIRKCSNADDVSPKPYISSKIEKIPSDPFIVFRNITLRYLKAMEDLYNLSETKLIGKSEIINGDALNIKTQINMDIAITSPPYINAFDYARTLRLENLWLGLETEETIRDKKKSYVGTENIKINSEEDLSILDLSSDLKHIYYTIEPIDKKRAIIVKKFFEDMKVNLLQVKNVLKNNSRYCIVIGDSTIRKVNVNSWSILCDIAESIGFQTETYFSYVIQNHYLRIPRGKRGGKINKDFVIVLKKTT
jgi:DNA modification methylase